MKATENNRGRKAFTLVEMLVVVAIIGALAGLVFAVLPGVVKNRNLKRLQGEHAALVTAIENYKAGQGYYPPGNSNDTAQASLFYEIKGVSVNPQGDQFVYHNDPPLRTDVLTSVFGVPGIANAAGPDEPRAQDYFPAMPDKMVDTIPGGQGAKRMVSGLSGGDGEPLVFHYDVTSTNRNNLETFDLWIETQFKGKTHRVDNW